MRHLLHINTSGRFQKVPTKLPEKLELGNLTIFIGRSNSGKTRILQSINKCVENETKLTSFYIGNNETIVNTFEGRSNSLSKAKVILKYLDNSIEDLGNKDLEFKKRKADNLSNQGSGIHRMLNIQQGISSNSKVLIIDEPENCLFPNGKIGLLKQLISELRRKQVIIATHDPTFINSYLIKKMINEKGIMVKIYSASNEEFKKIDFESGNIVPEIHAGYLSQTYSSKPVHLFLEGQTDYYIFQALLPKFCIMNKIKDFSYIMSRIAMFYMGGGQWKNHVYHLPNNEYFNTIVLLDGEYKEEIKELDKEEFHIIEKDLDFVEGKPNVCTLTKEKIEYVFKGVFGNGFSKPYELSEIIWNLSQEEFEEKWKKYEKEVDIQKIEKILNWVIEKAKN